MRIKPAELVSHTGLIRSAQQPRVAAGCPACGRWLTRVWPLADPRAAAGCPACGRWLSRVTDSENTFFTAESPVGQGCAPVSALRVPGPGPIHTARALSHARLAAAEDITGPRGLVPVACTASDLRGGPGHLATTSFFGHVPLLSLPCRCPRLASGSSNCRFSPCPLPPAWGPARLAPEKAGGRRRAQHDFLAGIPPVPHTLPASRVRPRQAPPPPPAPACAVPSGTLPPLSLLPCRQPVCSAVVPGGRLLLPGLPRPCPLSPWLSFSAAQPDLHPVFLQNFSLSLPGGHAACCGGRNEVPRPGQLRQQLVSSQARRPEVRGQGAGGAGCSRGLVLDFLPRPRAASSAPTPLPPPTCPHPSSHRLDSTQMALLNVTCLLGVETLLPGSLVGQKRRDLALAPRRLTWARLSRGGLGPPARPLTVSLLRSPVVSHGNPRPPAPSSVVEWGLLPAARGGLPPFHGLCPDREPGSGSTYSPGSGPPMLTAAPLAHAFSEWGSRPGVPHSWGSEISASRATALGRGGHPCPRALPQ